MFIISFISWFCALFFSGRFVSLEWQLLVFIFGFKVNQPIDKHFQLQSSECNWTNFVSFRFCSEIRPILLSNISWWPLHFRLRVQLQFLQLYKYATCQLSQWQIEWRTWYRNLSRTVESAWREG